MPENLELPPNAACLTASLRDLGYSLATAVADLIDNSITAGASNVDIVYMGHEKEPYLALVDDGDGMTQEVMTAAMRLGSMHARHSREAGDLGRFGLGLKTASFSQCRQLTVFSVTSTEIAGACWDLDVVEEQNRWILQILDESEIRSQPLFDRIVEKGGTVVLWSKLDRLLEDQIGASNSTQVYQKLDEVHDHLALVFHRFLSGDLGPSRRLKISLNNHPIEPIDPFCSTNQATQLLPLEHLTLNDARITIQPYILPHHSRLTERERLFYKERSNFLNHQGVYVYRQGRLIAWGDWFRLIQKSEATKLARIQIDFPNSLDEAWTIDIKKSRAKPPSIVREYIKKLLPNISTRSLDIHRRRGQKLHEKEPSPVWSRQASDQGVNYHVNLEHPLVQNLTGQLASEHAQYLRTLCQVIASAVPVELIYSDCAENFESLSQRPDHDLEDIRERLAVLYQAMSGDTPMSPEHFLEIVNSTRLFSHKTDNVIHDLVHELISCQ